MSKHTPVTWFVDIEGNRILANDDRATIICHMSATVRNPEVMADANRIAAVPELLYAAELAESLLRTGNGGILADGPTHHALIAAIAKAKGESA